MCHIRYLHLFSLYRFDPWRRQYVPDEILEKYTSLNLLYYIRVSIYPKHKGKARILWLIQDFQGPFKTKSMT